MIEGDERIHFWQKPIPPALQKRHEEYEEMFVKPSRIWIEMTGDHNHYTNDFRIVMMFRTKDDWFDVRPRTEYENIVQEHYNWMRTIMWDESRQTHRDKFYFVNMPPPSHEEACAADAAECATEKNDEETGWVNSNFSDECRRNMHDIIVKYIEHQGM
jgi:hypothetical protein